MLTSALDYDLPPDLIAQEPPAERTAARMLVLHRTTGARQHCTISDLPELLRPGDLLVLNDTRVIPARLAGAWADTGGAVELLLLEEGTGSDWADMSAPCWLCLCGSGRRPRPGLRLAFGALSAEIVSVAGEGRVVARFEAPRPLLEMLETHGRTPLPPYIRRQADDARAPADRARYQTVYARQPGAVAAPTAGLHFTPELIQSLQAQGVRFAFVTLHIGLDTFRPIAEEEIEQHRIHAEYCVVGEETVQAVRQTKAAGGRVIAIGTTAVRALESASRQEESKQVASRQVASRQGVASLSTCLPDTCLPTACLPDTCLLAPYTGYTSLYITPGYQFRVVDAMITNFHLPRSTLLCLVSAFAGRELILRAYGEAMRLGYRFYSFGDAMLLL